jgi:hypothetical protein
MMRIYEFEALQIEGSFSGKSGGRGSSFRNLLMIDFERCGA